MEASNVKAMREALVAVKKSIDGIGASSLDCDPTILMASLTQVCARLSARIERALSTPPRNCDVGTPEEQAERFGRHCDTFTRDSLHCENCPCCGKIKFGRCEFAWAQMPFTQTGGNVNKPSAIDTGVNKEGAE